MYMENKHDAEDAIRGLNKYASLFMPKTRVFSVYILAITASQAVED